MFKTELEKTALLNQNCQYEKTSADALVKGFLPVLTGEHLEVALAFLAVPARKYEGELPTLRRGATGYPTHTEVWVERETFRVTIEPYPETGTLKFQYSGQGYGPRPMCWKEDEFLCFGTKFVNNVVVQRAIHLPTGKVWEGPEDIRWSNATGGTFEHVWQRARLKITGTPQRIDQGPLGGIMGRPTDWSTGHECPDWQPAPAAITA